jgi:hypothetical protein
MPAVILLGLLLLASGAGATPGAPACDSGTSLTVLGTDTAARQVLLSFGDGQTRWIADLRLAEGEARVYPDPAAAQRFGGSWGPGPVLAATRCGPRCVQVLRWRGGWEPLGESMLASERHSFEGTWDASGTPWMVLQSLAGVPGTLAVMAYRLEGGEWRSKGGLAVQGAGSPALVPAPDRSDAVVVGTGRFHAQSRPESWLQALPSAPEAALGQVVDLGGGAGAALLGQGSLFLTRDGGRTWRELRRQPWSPGEGDLAWRPGRHYWLELPEGSLAPPLGVVWIDNRVGHRRQLFLTELTASGDWQVRFQGPEGILTAGGERLPFNHIVRFTAGRWLLLSGCVSRPDGGALAFRELDEGGPGEPRVVPLLPAAP